MHWGWARRWSTLLLLRNRSITNSEICSTARDFSTQRFADLAESTSLSKRQQSGAIKALIDAGLVECEKRGMPARRCFRVRDDVALVDKIIAQGKDIMTDLNPISQKLCENVPTSCPENAQQVGAKRALYI